ncbi:binding-protein-dependent transport systems inner membrane component [Alicyclobacillus hesperidum URH17-3-68]|uniref:Carbohydrate ABC transporter membrane protein 1, CUT1 family n=1 Tax=Alicyclobacillus hesperidum TaxID=89784 RepID=A0A1H2QCW6_9BACL|nr:sugar ABC transporter permease [Alicyclobacillus hesperidum]EJY54668.1 binding-protein-dependent transport systems inner membrane component [Alicyclobacillus hesperidum URH17-3-68]GLV12714.1 trehalose/maltose ABC transporter permease [Alicyclobacillus hesperidum]SDW04494.1 carbohydrate ABC transporter membrane protein 1, CUT1 family [Alicyclobacillus hesperidum]
MAMEAASTGKKERRSGILQRTDVRAGWGLLTPAGIVILAVTIFPIVYSLFMSFNNIQLTTNGFQFTFTGLQNYKDVYSAPLFWHSVGFTIYYSVITVAVELFFGLLIALAIQNVERLKSISIIVMLIPWALITVISAQMWGYIYNGVYGVLNAILQGLHIIHTQVNWLGQPFTAVVSLMIADIWKTTPFVVIILLSGLQMIPKDYYEAALIDGANAWQSFWNVTFPQLRGSIALAGLFRILQAFGIFDLPFVLTQGGPGTTTTSLAMLGEETLFTNLHFGLGAAVAISTVILILGACLIFLSAFRGMVGEEAQ